MMAPPPAVKPIPNEAIQCCDELKAARQPGPRGGDRSREIEHAAVAPETHATIVQVTIRLGRDGRSTPKIMTRELKCWGGRLHKAI